MSTLTILSIVLVVLIILPIVVAWIYYLSTSGSVMSIRQDKVRDQRYFAHSFKQMIEKALPTAEGNTLKLSREEHFIDGEQLLDHSSDTVEELVIIRDGSFKSPDSIKDYNKEIYLGGNAVFRTPEVTARAAYSAGRMCLGNKTNIIRWVDAEDTLAVYDDCDLGVSATAGNALSIGKNVSFRRLYAPVIYFGQYPDALIDPLEGRDLLKFTLPLVSDKRKAKHVTNENATELGTAPYSIVTPSKTLIVEDITLQGDIHAMGSVRICSGAGVLGNIFAEGSILLEAGCFVAGNVFSQEKLEIEHDVLIGKKGTSVSVISRGKMTIKENVVIYGYVNSEAGGMVCPIYEENVPRHEPAYEFIDFRKEYEDVSFRSLEEFELADDAAFRKHDTVRSAALPEGALGIRQSMFFACRNLKKVVLPSSLTAIEDFGLADCTELTEMTSLADTALTEIGTSGLENCTGLRRLDFPATIERIGPSACAGMSGLEEVSFAHGARLVSLEDHAFRDCKKLKKLVFPRTLTHVGVSAFRGCDHLRSLTVPLIVSSEPGIAELKELLPELKVDYIV